MAKAIPKISSHRNGRIGSRKGTRRIPKGVIHVQAGTRRGTPFVVQSTTANSICTVVDQGMQRAEVMIKGPGLRRDATLRAIRRSGIPLTFVQDVTHMPHNGCRPPEKRRV
ncbi:30S ribosomal protein S11, chloroplastic [Datura stramonium]|uniref:30S ribosomal protein S11, chloroplastic n=1 Tax=Datura stramonium TaxID=4076 RepID=A0ABS8RIH8_DATST|nr:30S ribosomal protein S11, chloroplastic [Datura stramonium]